jgi:hypothetical protein
MKKNNENKLNYELIAEGYGCSVEECVRVFGDDSIQRKINNSLKKLLENNYDTNIDDLIEFIENPVLKDLTPNDYGKVVQIVAEKYLELRVNKISESNLVIDIRSDQQLINEYNYSNNGPGFDRLIYNSKSRVQIKFRQVQGKTPYSRQTHFSNTRRHSGKNIGNGDATGNIVYRLDEFDYVIVILCHIKNKKRVNYTEWCYSLIPGSELVDVNNNKYCMPNIPSVILNKYKCDDIYMLTKKLESL